MTTDNDPQRALIEAHTNGVRAGLTTALALVETRMQGHSAGINAAGAAMVRKSMARYGEARAIRDALAALPGGLHLRRSPDLPTAQDHADAGVRDAVDRIAVRLVVQGKGATDAAVDAAMAGREPDAAKGLAGASPGHPEGERGRAA